MLLLEGGSTQRLPAYVRGTLLAGALFMPSPRARPAGIWAALAAAGCAGLWCEQTKWGKEMSGALLRCGLSQCDCSQGYQTACRAPHH